MTKSNEFYFALEPIESDFDWWQLHPDDMDLADDLANKSEALLEKVARNVEIDKVDRHRICRILMRINNACTDAVSGIDVSGFVKELVKS